MLKVGSVVSSQCGHDKDRLYVVLSIKDLYAFVCDGEYRLVNNPKRKNIKHLFDTGLVYEVENKNIYDYQIATYLKSLRSLHN